MTIDDALEYAEDFGDEWDGVPLKTLAAEVRRLREERNTQIEYMANARDGERAADAEVERLRGVINSMSTNEGQLHLKIARIETKIARVEEVSSNMECECDDDREDDAPLCYACLLANALRDV